MVTFDIVPSEAMSGESSAAEPKVTFWEALGGQQYELPHPCDDKNLSSQTPKKTYQKHSFCELHCLFRHNCFMVNIQPVCTVPNARQQPTRPDVAPLPVMSFSIASENNFALFPSHALSPVLQHPGCGMHLSYDDHFSQRGHISALEVSIEKALRDEIANRRYEKSLYTHFDEKLSIILQVDIATLCAFVCTYTDHITIYMMSCHVMLHYLNVYTGTMNELVSHLL